MNPTIADVAQLAGVSTATVSRVLNDHPVVAQNTRLRVLNSVEQLGYKPLQTSKHKDPLRYMTIIAHTVDSEYGGVLIHGILDQLDLDAYQAVLHLSQADLTREIDYVHAAKRTGSDGLLILTSRMRDRDLSNLISDSVPYVFIDYYPDSPSVPCVRATNWQGARDATNYLISLGHQRIGFIAGRRGGKIAEAREHGYRSALADASITFAPELVLNGDYKQVSGYRAGRELLDLQDCPTAIFASSDLMALGAMSAAYASGLRVPQDVSIVGFDDIPSSTSWYPPLTTVQQPLYQMGRMAAQMVTALATGQELVSPQVELPTLLVVRESCCQSPDAR